MFCYFHNLNDSPSYSACSAMLLLHLLLPTLTLACYDGCFKWTKFMHGIHNRYEALPEELKTCSEALAWTCEADLECLSFFVETKANLTVYPEMEGDTDIQVNNFAVEVI
eukprot:sb/3477254/